MKFPAYPAYKPSGVEWLGDVPKHWEVKRLRHVAQLRNEKVVVNEEDSLPYVGMEHIESWTGRLLPLDEELVPTGISNRFRSDSLLFGKLRPYLAKACKVDFDGICSSELLVLETKEQDRVFLLYQLLSEGFVSVVDSSTYGAKMPRASWDFIGHCELLVPPVEEQHAIANFLNTETKKIDTLAEKKRALIEKLREKRFALVSRTVTRGLPPEAARTAGLNSHPKLRPSGIDWLGDAPEHWETKRIGHIAFLKSGDNITAEQIAEEGNYPVFGGNGLRGYASNYTHNGHYVLIGRQGALCGNINYANGKFWASEHAIVVSALVSFDVRWIGELLRSMNLNQYSVSAAQPGLSVGMISSLRIPFPPRNEQHAIAEFLDCETAKIDRMIEKVEAAIEKLQEYRTALIMAAVTGKIDVRGITQ